MNFGQDFMNSIRNWNVVDPYKAVTGFSMELALNPWRTVAKLRLQVNSELGRPR